MTIKEVENQTGLTRSNVRFYEKEKLIEPSRNESNGYREYSEKDVEDIKKIAYLRTLGVSIEEIRNIISGQTTLCEVMKKQGEVLKGQITELNQAQHMCEKILEEENVTYDTLKVEKYVEELPDYWKENAPVFKLDSVSFLYLWGSFAMWVFLTVLCLMTAVLFYEKLPPEIPVQWNNGVVSSMVNKKFIFAYPVFCAVIRYLLRPILYVKLQVRNFYREIIAEYLTNYICFVALSAEVFSILFLYGIVKNIVLLLAVDTIVLLGMLLAGLVKMDLRAKK
ncbi:MAG: MerR family transcriptional regulator [Eubacteriales bacterium]|nr:MerR family transcriptional regulator [Eubacteriales bacterium]